MSIEEMTRLADQAEAEGTQADFIDMMLAWAKNADQQIVRMMRLLQEIDKQGQLTKDLRQQVHDATTVTGTLNLQEIGQALGRAT